MRDSAGNVGRMSRVHITNTVAPVQTPTTSRAKIQGFPLTYRVSASAYCHHSHFQPGSSVGVQKPSG